MTIDGAVLRFAGFMVLLAWQVVKPGRWAITGWFALTVKLKTWPTSARLR